jgi:hypothetical protein
VGASCGGALSAAARLGAALHVPPMIYPGNPTLAEPGMALFLYAILVNAPRNLVMSLGPAVRP